MKATDIDAVVGLLDRYKVIKRQIAELKTGNNIQLYVGSMTILSGTVLSDEARSPGTHAKERVTAAKTLLIVAEDMLRLRHLEVADVLRTNFGIIITD